MDLQHNAQITYAELSDTDAATMPLDSTPHNFANVIKELLGRPYGWGNIYFYNDCATELKNLYVPFGIWLPTFSKDQVKAGKILVDLSSEKDAQKRLNYLMENGRRFITLIYIGGHVMMYIGKFPNPYSDVHEQIAMTYQNIWGLGPADNSYRSVIGKAVFSTSSHLF
jgi:hypothetical protein